MEKTLSLKNSNDYIIKLIQNNDSFLVARPGLPVNFVYNYIVTNQIQPNTPQILFNSGIYGSTYQDYKIWFDKYINAIAKSDAICIWNNIMIQEQNLFVNKWNLTPVTSKIVEPFYCILDNITPWTHYLLGKKVLIISPFIDSFKKQLANNFKIFKDKEIFLEKQEFVFYKSFNTSVGNHIHKNWIETFDIMCKEIEKLDFDIALLGCGCYGHPLCDYIKHQLNKSSIYVGGGLQLLFGVMGKRWESTDLWKQIIKENNCQFIRPSGDEIPKNSNRVEGGCYW
jgi:hypothetical protein